MAMGVAAFFAKRRPSPAPGAVAMAAMAALFLLPMVIEAARHLVTGQSAPWEIFLLAGLRNLGLGLAALVGWRAGGMLATIVSLFLTIVATALGDSALSLGIAVVYSLAGTLWLMMAYWSRIRIAPASGRGMPIMAPAVVVLLIGSAAVVAALGPSRSVTLLAGFFPSSGGVDDANPEARGGVNDGDNEVSASQKPQSIGFADSNVYLETDKSSLYDVSNDMYGEPFRRKKFEKMIALKPTEVTEQKERPSENLRAGQQFSMNRKPARKVGRKPSQRNAKALVYVKGPSPQHLALSTFDRFDGETWSDEGPCSFACPLELEPGTSWFHVASLPSDIHGGTVSHQIKVGLLNSSPMPIPAHVSRFRIGNVNRADFFAWAQHGILRMTGRTVPAGTTIEVESRTVDPRLLRNIGFPKDVAIGAPQYRELPPELSSRAVDLARSWAKDNDRGWGQVEAVAAGVRSRCTLDRHALVPKDCPDLIDHFLFQSRKGQDYQFAAATAVLLRSLGYATRLVSGFYVSPHRYDRRTKHTPVVPEDVHVWLQVQIPNGTWIDLEPTPGYELFGPALTWGEWALTLLAEAGRKLRSHWFAPAGLLVVLGLAAWFRRELSDLVFTALWRLTNRRPSRRGIVRALRLVERRSRWAGHPRPSWQTPARWYGRIAEDAAQEQRDEIQGLISLVQWACYAARRAGMAVASPRRGRGDRLSPGGSRLDAGQVPNIGEVLR